jgi:hypothetical protein
LVLHNLQALNQVKGYENSSVTAEIQYVNEESSILQRIEESRAELEKLKTESREMELNLLFFEALRNENLVANLQTVDDLIDLINVIEKKLKEIDIKMAELK